MHTFKVWDAGLVVEYSLLWFSISVEKTDSMTDFDVGAETECNLFEENYW